MNDDEDDEDDEVGALAIFHGMSQIRDFSANFDTNFPGGRAAFEIRALTEVAQV